MGGDGRTSTSSTSTSSSAASATRAEQEQLTTSNIEIPRGDINCNWTEEEQIGSGAYGVVYKGRVYGIDVAVKVPKTDNEQPLTDVQIEKFRKEAKLMGQIRSPNVCRFIGISTMPGAIMIITELLEGGDLEAVLKEHPNRLSSVQIVKWSKDIATGMIFVHKQGLCHHDLKPANLMFDRHGVVKVCDFGLAEWKPLEKSEKRKGSYFWMAPEIMKKRPYDNKADVYSFALIIWQMLAKKVYPYDTYKDAATLIRDVADNHYRLPFPAHTFPSIKELVTLCWSPSPTARPDFKQIHLALESIAIEVHVSDEVARMFWRTCFPHSQEVSWTEFRDKWYHFFDCKAMLPSSTQLHRPTAAAQSAQLSANPSADDIMRASLRQLEELSQRSEHMNLVARQEVMRREYVRFLNTFKDFVTEAEKVDNAASGEPRDGRVSLERFGNITHLFGPLQPTNIVGFLDRMVNVRKQRWFRHPESRAQAYHALKDQPEGTFLIRVGGEAKQDFVISMVHNHQVVHVTVVSEPGKGFTLRGDMLKMPSFATLDQLVFHAQSKGYLGPVCPPSYGNEHLFSEDALPEMHGYRMIDVNSDSGAGGAGGAGAPGASLRTPLPGQHQQQPMQPVSNFSGTAPFRPNAGGAAATTTTTSSTTSTTSTNTGNNAMATCVAGTGASAAVESTLKATLPVDQSGATMMDQARYMHYSMENDEHQQSMVHRDAAASAAPARDRVVRQSSGTTDAIVQEMSDVQISSTQQQQQQQQQQASSQPLSARELVEHQTRLEQRLAVFRVAKSGKVAEGGNSQFAAISHQMWGTTEYHAVVRTELVGWLLAHKNWTVKDNLTIAAWMPQRYASWEAYCEQMARDQHPGDNLTLTAACEHYRMVVNVIDSMPGDIVGAEFLPQGGEANHRINLCKWPVWNFESLVPLEPVARNSNK